MKRTNYIYIVGDKAFYFDGNNQSTFYQALKYSREIGLKKDEIVRIDNEDELDYYNYLRAEKGIKKVICHSKQELLGGFTNVVGDEISPIEVDIPFVYQDEKDTWHYEWLITSLLDVTIKLIFTKKLFDKIGTEGTNLYLKIVYLNNEGEYIEWKLDDYDQIAKDYRSEAHKKVIAQRKAMREQQRFDRLMKLREEGKITDNQRNELYKLEAKYRGN